MDTAYLKCNVQRSSSGSIASSLCVLIAPYTTTYVRKIISSKKNCTTSCCLLFSDYFFRHNRGTLTAISAGSHPSLTSAAFNIPVSDCPPILAFRYVVGLEKPSAIPLTFVYPGEPVYDLVLVGQHLSLFNTPVNDPASGFPHLYLPAHLNVSPPSSCFSSIHHS